MAYSAGSAPAASAAVAAASGESYSSSPIFGSWVPQGDAPLFPGTPGGLPPHMAAAFDPSMQPPPPPPPAMHQPSMQAAEEEPFRRPVIRVRLPRPRHPGSPEFYGGVPKRAATFAWSEICATRDPNASLAPVPQTETKSWYNSYLYHPEDRSHVENQFLDRFVQGPDGEWIDVIKARRMSSHMEEKREQAMVKQMERAMIMSGSVIQQTGYVDPYSGEHLVSCRGELVPKQQLLEQFGDHFSAGALREMVAETQGGFDWDNLRVPWPFGRPYRNKQVSQHAYDWFDRQNPYIPTDRSCEMLELPSMFVDRHQYERSGDGAHPSTRVAEYMYDHATLQPPQRVQHVQM